MSEAPQVAVGADLHAIRLRELLGAERPRSPAITRAPDESLASIRASETLEQRRERQRFKLARSSSQEAAETAHPQHDSDDMARTTWVGLCATYGQELVGPLDAHLERGSRDLEWEQRQAAIDWEAESERLLAEALAELPGLIAEAARSRALMGIAEADLFASERTTVARALDRARACEAAASSLEDDLTTFLGNRDFHALSEHEREYARVLSVASELAWSGAQFWRQRATNVADALSLPKPPTFLEEQRQIDAQEAMEALEAIRQSTPDPEALWSCGRGEIEHVMAMARRLKMSPWALLAATIGRAAASVPWYVPFRSFMGRRPINLLIAQAGGTGTGKTATDQAAADIFTWPHDLGRVLEAGSGEAIPAAFAYIATRDEKDAGVKRGAQVWRHEDHMARFMFDEIGRLNAIQGRQGATVLEYLKTGESGGDLGRVLASGEGVQVPAGEYRLVATLNVQPERATLITSSDEAAGGFPGRMLWASTQYAAFVDMPRDRRHVEAFPLAHLNWTAVDAIDALPEMEDAFEAQQDRAHAGTLDPMESHANLLRAKVAVCLMVLNGRQALVSADWALAGLVLEHSRRIRAHVLRSILTVDSEASSRPTAAKELTVIRAMERGRSEGMTAVEARKHKLNSQQRKVWDRLVAEGATSIW